ncbi:MAG: hypothetical protein AB1571_01505 [Nanoarchaeota archaeon]
MNKIRLFIFDRRNINLRIKNSDYGGEVIKTLEDEIQNTLGYPSVEYYVKDTNDYDVALNLIREGYDFILLYKLNESDANIINLIKLDGKAFKIIAYDKKMVDFKNIQERKYMSELENMLGKIIEQLVIKDTIKNIIFCDEVDCKAIQSLIKKIKGNREQYNNKNFFYNNGGLSEVRYEIKRNEGILSRIFK